MNSRLKYIRINPIQPEKEKIALAARIISAGGVVAYPTETVYGLGCDAFNRTAVERIFALKGREPGKSVILIVRSVTQLRPLVATIPPAAQTLMSHFWPGPLTLVFSAHPALQSLWPGGGNTVAIRIPASAICLELLAQCQVPLVSTSANRSGAPPATAAEQVQAAFPENLDLIIDGGPSLSQMPSTVIDCSANDLCLIRAGAIEVEAIKAVMGAITLRSIETK